MIGERTPLACYFRPLAENFQSNANFSDGGGKKKAIYTQRGAVPRAVKQCTPGGVRSPDSQAARLRGFR